MSGQRLGRYRLERLLGQGGMGQVWLAHAEPAGGRPGGRVALKLLPVELAADQTYRSRFEREAELAARLHDSHIVPIHAHGALDGRLFIEMEYVEGDDLGRVLRSNGPLPPRRAVDIVAQTAAALDAAHRAGLVHRDVKPSNIVVRRDGFVYLIDFGIAHGVGSTALTASGLAVGTWAYMAPERFTGSTDARADIYSLGCVLYECLAGTRPFGDTDPARQMHDHLTTPPPSVRMLVPGVPVELDRVIARALAKNPDDRYRTAGEFARAARGALGAATAPDPGAVEHPGTRHYELDDRPAAAVAAHPGTRAYTAYEPGSPAAEQSPAYPGTRAYTEYAPGDSAVRQSPSHPATRAYTGHTPGDPGPVPPAAHPSTRAYTRLETRPRPGPAQIPGPAPHGRGNAGPAVAPNRPAPHAPGPPPRRRPARPRTKPPRRRKSLMRRLLLWPIVLVVVPLLLIGGCVAALAGGAGSIRFFGGDGTPAAGSVADPGVPVRDGNFEFAVRDVVSGVSAVGIERAEGTFVVVSFTVRNIAAQPKTYLPLGQELHDTAGAKYAPDVTATAQRAAAAAAPRTLQPDESLGTHLVYEIPIGSVPARMTFRDFPLSFGTTVALDAR
ncbi:serine/threonine-protein kinase [Nocardia grenadensis]|uniref:serine/threonine-protein kinase n=1 Tax=Nocardia grenadensis TaxID=931537 RepID=UPI0007A49BDE|nr:serine/threonine-protein kinase [Nocardia grenadensis]